MFEPVAYGASLLVALVCLGLIDHRFRLVFFKDSRRAIRTIVVAILFFALWDILGITLHIFYSGSATVISRVFIAPNFPIEELLFLALLVYSTMILWKSTERWL